MLEEVEATRAVPAALLLVVVVVLRERRLRMWEEREVREGWGEGERRRRAEVVGLVGGWGGENQPLKSLATPNEIIL